MELKTLLKISTELGYLPKSKEEKLLKATGEVAKKLSGLNLSLHKEREVMINKIKPSQSDVHSLNPQSSILNPFQDLKENVQSSTHSIQNRAKKKCLG